MARRRETGRLVPEQQQMPAARLTPLVPAGLSQDLQLRLDCLFLGGQCGEGHHRAGKVDTRDGGGGVTERPGGAGHDATSRRKIQRSRTGMPASGQP